MTALAFAISVSAIFAVVHVASHFAILISQLLKTAWPYSLCKTSGWNWTPAIFPDASYSCIRCIPLYLITTLSSCNHLDVANCTGHQCERVLMVSNPSSSCPSCSKGGKMLADSFKVKYIKIFKQKSQLEKISNWLHINSTKKRWLHLLHFNHFERDIDNRLVIFTSF